MSSTFYALVTRTTIFQTLFSHQSFFANLSTAGWNEHSHADWVPLECLSASPPLLWAHLARCGLHLCTLSVALRPEQSPQAAACQRKWKEKCTRGEKKWVWSWHLVSCKGDTEFRSAKVNSVWKVNKTQNCSTRAHRPYPNFFILPFHRLLQVRYFSNKTLLFYTQLTDLLHSRERK